jgi:hypothetical protein
MRDAMSHPANPFRLVYRSFDRTLFDRIKSDNMFALRGFDLVFIGQLFPGYVLERPATLYTGEPRLEVLAEAAGIVFLIVYTRLGRACRLMTGWVAEPQEAALWFHPNEAAEWDTVGVTALPGRIDPVRLGTTHPHDNEPRPAASSRDLAATHAELAVLYRRVAGPAHRRPLSPDGLAP